MESLESLETIVRHAFIGVVAGGIGGAISRSIEFVAGFNPSTKKGLIYAGIGVIAAEVFSQMRYASSPPYALGMGLGVGATYAIASKLGKSRSSSQLDRV